MMSFHLVFLVHAMVFGGHDEHQVRGDHVEAQHARERRVQVDQVSQHLLPGEAEFFSACDDLLPQVNLGREH